ncbi:MAG: Cys-tRNA(Pro) deacylase [Betaproteobacteria bacterium]
MAKGKTPVSPAIRELRAAQVEFTDHLYTYEDQGGTEVSARELGVAEHSVIKTLIMQNDAQSPLVVLMHGDKQVSTKELARLIGVKTISPCSPEAAQRHTGYMVGGTSPFGTRRKLPVFMERTILELPRIYINGGKRGYLVGLSPADAVRLLQPQLVTVAVAK